MEIIFKTRQEWRTWLEQNHDKETEIWLIYFKKHTCKSTVSYNEAVEEALCFGWIDGKVKAIDKNRYMQRFTPRKPKSIWSMVNKERALKMIKESKMTEAGFQLIEEAKKSGWWEKAYETMKTEAIISEDILESLKNNSPALDNFMNFTVAQRNQYIFWIDDAKKQETRERRIHKMVERVKKNLKAGMM